MHKTVTSSQLEFCTILQVCSIDFTLYMYLILSAQGCALRIIQPVLSICEIQGVQHYDFCEKKRFSSGPGANVWHQELLGTTRAQPQCHKPAKSEAKCSDSARDKELILKFLQNHNPRFVLLLSLVSPAHLSRQQASGSVQASLMSKPRPREEKPPGLEGRKKTTT